MSDNGSISGVGVLDKAASIIAALEDGPLALGHLVEATGFSRATAHRLATALEKHGLVRRDARGRFALGLRLVALGRAAAESALPLPQVARPYLERLRDTTGESVQLYVRDGDRRICVESLQSPHGLRTIVAVGASLPLDRGSAGKALTMSRSAFWAESVAEREAGVASVSAPVRDGGGRTIAAVSVSGPIERLSRSPGAKYGEEVMTAALRIELALGVASAP
ncbi:MAG: IclR family transcriptional regulator [Actinomycetota bacterium]